ncbi:MAG: ABC transporter permease [Leucobacter sp.]
MKTLQTWLKPLARWEVSLIGVLILELIVFSALSPKFLDPSRMLFSMSDFVYLGIIALPLGIVMITGGIDISFASIASLAAIIMGVTFKSGANIWVAVVVGLVAALLAGLLNGVLIIVTRANPMVITLGTQFLFAGLALAASGLGGVSAFEGVSGLPEEFTALAGGKTFGLPNMLIVFIVFAILFAILLSRTTFGRQARLIGANPVAARYAGFRSDAVLIGAYMLTAFAAGIVGILLSSYVGSARADVGSALLMPVLTLVVIGGVSMYGGEGTIFGVIVATFVIGFLQQGLRFARLTENEVAVFTGVILVTVASLRWWSGRWSEKARNNRVRRSTVRRRSETEVLEIPAPIETHK